MKPKEDPPLQHSSTPPLRSHPAIHSLPRWVWLLLLIPIGLGLARLRFDVEVFDLLPTNLRVVEGLKLYEQHFANARELIITMRAADAEQAEHAAKAVAENLRQATNLVSTVTWEAPWLEAPAQAAELMAYLWLNQPPEVFHSLAERLAPAKLPAELAAAREQLATSLSPQEIALSGYDPFGLTRLPESAAGAAPGMGQGQEIFSSPDGKFRLVFVQANRELRTYRECDRWLRAIKQRLESAQPGIAVHAAVSDSLSMNRQLGTRWREFPLSPSEGERAGVRGPFSALSSVAAASRGTLGSEHETLSSLLSPALSSKGGEGEGVTASTGEAADPGGVVLGFTGRPAFVAETALSMQHDIHISVGGTAVIIAILFWLAHRRVKPMLWLLTLLALILGSTLALGGLIYGAINVVSMGFAAILLGLAVDYAVVHYQEALAHPDLSIPEIRHAIAPSIFWAAVTTISAFLVLNFGGLPGLGQLGTMVGLGVALSACIMIFEFLPPLFPDRRQPQPRTRNTDLSRRSQTKAEHGLAAPKSDEGGTRITHHAQLTSFVFWITAVLLISTAFILSRGLPAIDPTANALRPRNSQAYEAVSEIQKFMNQKREPLWLIIGGKTENQVGARLDQLQSLLDHAVTNGCIAGFTLPTPLWPRPDFQAANRDTARQLAAERIIFREAARTNGFAESSLALTERILDTWQTAATSSGTFWPTNRMSQWIFDKLVARTATNYFALGLLNPPREVRRNGHPATWSSALQAELRSDQVWLSGWELLGDAIFSRVKANMWKVLAPMISLVLLSLWLAFKHWREILLSLAVLLLSALCLLSVMKLAGWSWNLLNLMAIPLILGTGVDYGIFMQLALRRYHGDLVMAHRAVGRALLLCGGTAIAGFGSLGLSTNAGMASLGQVCAVGIGFNMLISIFLLPRWRRGKCRVSSVEAGEGYSPLAPRPSTPSSLYRPQFWRLGLWLVRCFPRGFCDWLSRLLAGVYLFIARHRRRVVIENLAPALDQDWDLARQKTRKLFDHFALKLVDLWHYEAALPMDHLLGQNSGWDHFKAAQAQKRGVLLVTPHLGNWEFGAPWLAKLGVQLQVVTLAEPGKGFTELRQASRARWNIDTLVIGDDPFASIEIVRRLEAGSTVALLIDRPPPATSITVELFGRPFAASIAAAELARASGCAVLPVYLPRVAGAYDAHILPAIPYDRATLRDREARREFTQQILRALEPIIHKYADQWYHFVPIWPE